MIPRSQNKGVSMLTFPPTTNLDRGLLSSFAKYRDSSSSAIIEGYSANAKSIGSKQASIEEVDSAQIVLRESFGRGGYKTPAIGDHPDFIHLRGTTDTCYCPIATLFMDIEGSTRLSLLYSLEEVFAIKNAFIQSAIQIVQAFDGHVHRIMGDAVMAYFGGVMIDPDQAIIDAVNCAAVLRHFAEHVVRPELDKLGCDHEFGARVGLDFGKESDVLWSAYGYPGVEEVTATSFFVDVASKLQHAAGRNQVMFGESLYSHIDFPHELLRTKTVSRQGELVEKKHVEPNHKNREGKLMNYGQRILNTDYLRYTPLASRSEVYWHNSNRPFDIDSEIWSSSRETKLSDYYPASGAVEKDRWLRFKPRIPYLPRLPYIIRCSVENHGKEAWERRPSDGGNHSEEYSIMTESQHSAFAHWERTEYRGLHYLTIDIVRDGKVANRSKFGVYVK